MRKSIKKASIAQCGNNWEVLEDPDYFKKYYKFFEKKNILLFLFYFCNDHKM